jgi:hypothetical protein
VSELSRSLRSSDRERPNKKRLLFAGSVLTLAVVPAVVWYWNAYHAAAPGSELANRVFYSVRQSASVHRPPHPLLWSPDFYRQIVDDLAGVVLTPIGLVLGLAGCLHRDGRRYVPWLVAAGVLVLVLPAKFYEMNYYWMSVLPPLCIMVGLGWQIVWERLRPGHRATATLLAVSLLLSVRYAMRPAWTTPEEDRAVVVAGLAVQDRTQINEPVVTMHGTTIDLLYYCNRAGWAVPPDSPDLEASLREFRRRGARYLVVVSPGAANPAAVFKRLGPVFQGEGFRIYSLQSLDT